MKANGKMKIMIMHILYNGLSTLFCIYYTSSLNFSVAMCMLRCKSISGLNDRTCPLTVLNLTSYVSLLVVGNARN